MSEGATFILVVVCLFPALILVAVAVLLWEARRASRWPETVGRVVTSCVRSHKRIPGDANYNFGGSEVTNEPYVEYEYVVGGETYRGNKVTIGVGTADWELESILDRYPVGAEVTVYFDPNNPGKAVLERKLPWKMVAIGGGCLLAFFVGGPLIAAAVYFDAVDVLRPHLAKPERAPFVAVLGLFGSGVLLFSVALQRAAMRAASWPTTRGQIVSSGVETFRDWRRNSAKGSSRPRIVHKPSVVYAYEVNGRQFQGDRVNLGAIVTSTAAALAERVAAQYPVGGEVEVHYNPEAPGESVLNPRGGCLFIPWLIAAGLFALAWAAAAGWL